MNISMKNGRVVIDGREFSGSNIRINGNQVIVDGVVQDGELVGPISVQVMGDVDRLDMGAGDVAVQGAVGQVNTGSGDVECGPVTGSVRTGSGDVRCGNVGGSVQTGSGDIIRGRG
jgi:hypothetical protein